MIILILTMRESYNQDSDRVVINARLKEENLRMFLKLKEKYNLKYNIEVFHTILKKIYVIEFESTK
ncbi:unnamed protein product [marine sediment metagenome]|uniref:Uncharacterized protein n=1 Tax=marine sediment metagenome TaxID=412755 RepID=X1DDD5_9ZZZZ